MKLSRREFLGVAGRLGAALPFLLSPSGCAPVVTAVDSDTGLSLGYVAGDVTPDGAIIWLRAEPGSLLTVQYARDPSLSGFVATDPIVAGESSDGTARVELKQIEPASVYYYRAAVAGKRPGPIARFVTAPKPDDAPIVKFCFSGDSREGYQPFTIMDAINANQPNFFIHLGDTIYADRGGTATRLSEFWAKYRANRDAPSQRLFSDTSVYTIWDDHEVTNDYEGSPPIAVIGRKAFFDYWPVRHDPQEADRLYRSFRWGKGLELFLLDTRQYRDHKHEIMLGRRQKEWLFDRLAPSSALFKVIGTSVPVYGGGRDRWDGYPQERAELLQFISEKKIKGVVFICADLHYAAVAKLPGHLGLKQIVAGPIAAPMNVLATGNSKRFEFFSNKTFNFGMITIDPNSSTPQMIVDFRDQDNRRLYRTTLAVV
jgi:alkaline phosphatase D